MFRVIQSVEAFRYSEGKIWGPYVDRVDAEQRVGTLREFKGDGEIEAGEFGTPCGMTLVGAGGDKGGVAAVG